MQARNAEARNLRPAALFQPATMLRCVPLLIAVTLAGSCSTQRTASARPQHTVESLPAPPSGDVREQFDAAPVAAAGARGGSRAGGGTTAAGAVATAAGAGAAGGAAVVLPHDTGGMYRYGARFEPPRGRILHGMGQWPDGNASYMRLLQDSALMPASSLTFVPIGDWPRSWSSRLERLRAVLVADKAAGRVPQLNIALHGIDPVDRRQHGVDAEVAASDRHDGRIRDVARLVAELRGPVFLRIGGEFSGAWNDYHAYEFPKAYRKIAEIFRAEGADNVAYVWCYEPSAPDDFDVQDERGWRWFPGDDVIDWYGLDVFEIDEFVAQTGRRAGAGKWKRAERFLQMAREHGKPVIIAECSAVKEDLTPDLEDGRRDWNAWFVPFLAFLERHPEIEAFHYINTDWRATPSALPNDWKDARIERNSYVSEQWLAELRDPRYLHADDVPLLNGYQEASAPRAPPPPTAPQQDPPTPPQQDQPTTPQDAPTSGDAR